MPPTFILSQDQTLQFCIDSQFLAEAKNWRNQIKPKVDSAPEASVKTSSDSPFSFVLHENHWKKPATHIHTTKQQPRPAELNRSFITKLSNIIATPFDGVCRRIPEPNKSVQNTTDQPFPSGSRNIRETRQSVNRCETRILKKF